MLARTIPKPKRVNYRKLAFANYDPLCAHCGFGVPAVLEVAHLDADQANNDVSNLVILCPNCHKMHDLNLISTSTIIERDRPKIVSWSKRMKDAGQKALLTRLRRAAGRKAAETLRRRGDDVLSVSLIYGGAFRFAGPLRRRRILGPASGARPIPSRQIPSVGGVDPDETFGVRTQGRVISRKHMVHCLGGRQACVEGVEQALR